MQTRDFFAQSPLPALGKWIRLPEAPRWWTAQREPRPAPTRLISVIVPAHNEAEYLEKTLESLARQNYRWFEVIVVANGCTDGTADVARGSCHRLIVLSQKSLGVARNLGARMAKGEILVFLDADTTLEPMALRRVAEAFTPGHACGTVRGRPDSPKYRYRAVYALKNGIHRSRLHPGSSGVIVCWKKDFLRAGGFDEGLEVRENSELMRRLRRHGKYLFLGDVSATTSMRRFENRGFGRVTWLWLRLWLASLFGDLHRQHYEAVR